MKLKKLCLCGCGKELKGRLYYIKNGKIIEKRYNYGHNTPVLKHSIESRRKMSKNRKGVKFSEEHKIKIGNANRGKIRTPEQCKVNSEVHKGLACHTIPHTEESKKLISEKLKGKTPWNKGEKLGPLSDVHKQKLRESRIKYVEIVRLNGQPLYPCIGKNETYMLNELEKLYGYNIIRQYTIEGYFIDGYIPELNLAIEIDEKYHNSGKQLEKDKYREEEIKKCLNCDFLRIKDNA